MIRPLVLGVLLTLSGHLYAMTPPEPVSPDRLCEMFLSMVPDNSGLPVAAASREATSQAVASAFLLVTPVMDAPAAVDAVTAIKSVASRCRPPVEVLSAIMDPKYNGPKTSAALLLVGDDRELRRLVLNINDKKLMWPEMSSFIIAQNDPRLRDGHLPKDFSYRLTSPVLLDPLLGRVSFLQDEKPINVRAPLPSMLAVDFYRGNYRQLIDPRMENYLTSDAPAVVLLADNQPIAIAARFDTVHSGKLADLEQLIENSTRISLPDVIRRSLISFKSNPIGYRRLPISFITREAHRAIRGSRVTVLRNTTTSIDHLVVIPLAPEKQF